MEKCCKESDRSSPSSVYKIKQGSSESNYSLPSNASDNTLIQIISNSGIPYEKPVAYRYVRVILLSPLMLLKHRRQFVIFTIFHNFIGNQLHMTMKKLIILQKKRQDPMVLLPPLKIGKFICICMFKRYYDEPD